MKWEPSSKFCASSAHVGWAAAIFLAVQHHDWSPFWCVVLFVVYVILKEFWADLTWLERDTFTGSTLDAVTYLLGMGIGVLGFHWFWFGFIAAVSLLILLAVLDMAGFFDTLMSLSRSNDYDG